MERIGEAADSNKAQIYHYFGGKAQLFEAVCEQAIAADGSRGALRPLRPSRLRRPPRYACTSAGPRSCACAPGSAWNAPTASPARPASPSPAPRSTRSPRPRKPGTCPRTSTRASCSAWAGTWATGWVSVSPEFEAAIDVPAPEERARHVEDAIRALLSQPACA